MSDYGDRPLGSVSHPRAQGMRSSRLPSSSPLPRAQSAAPPQSNGAYSSHTAGLSTNRYSRAAAMGQGNHADAVSRANLPDAAASAQSPPRTMPPRDSTRYPRKRSRSGKSEGASGFSLRRWLAGNNKANPRPPRSVPTESNHAGQDWNRHDSQPPAYEANRNSAGRPRSSFPVVPPRKQLTVPTTSQAPNDNSSGAQPATSFDLSSRGRSVDPGSGATYGPIQGEVDSYQGTYYSDGASGSVVRHQRPWQGQSPQYSTHYSPTVANQPASNHSRPLTPHTNSKVTPLRPRRLRAPDPAVDSLPPNHEGRRREGRRREGRPMHRLPRRTQLPLPKFLLTAIRLLILGIGVAAIAGTLLSIFSPDRAEYVQNTGAPPPSAEAPAPGGTTSTQPSSLMTNALPLGTELVHLQDTLAELVTLTPGLTQSVFMVELDSGAYVDIDGAKAMPAASTIKVPILVAFLQAVDRGTVRLDQSLTLNQEDVGGGSGDLQYKPIGSQYSALEIASLMSVNSDNTATNMIINLLGGQDVLNRQFRDWGLTQTVIRNPLPDLSGTNTTSTQDLASLMARIDQGQLLELRSRDRLFAIMQRTKSRNLIPSGVGTEALTANKTGDIASMLGDVALIDLPNGTRYALAVITTRPENDGRARELIRRVSQEVYQELNQPTSPTGGEPPVDAPNVESEGSLVPQG